MKSYSENRGCSPTLTAIELQSTRSIDSIISILTDMLENADHNIGETYTEWFAGERWRNTQYADNTLCYDDDKWEAEIDYECCGEWSSDGSLEKAWGHITSIIVKRYDEEAEEESAISLEEEDKLHKALDNVLAKIY